MDKVARKSDLTKEIATVERDPMRPVYGGILTNRDAVLASEGQGRGLAVYDDLLRDCRVASVLEKRVNAVKHREWRVDPASNSRSDKRAADLVADQIKSMNFDHICEALLEGALLRGFSVAEAMWERDGSELRLATMNDIDAHRFVFDVQGNLRLLVQEDMVSGIPLPPRKFAVQTHRKRGHNVYGRGLGQDLFWPVWFKRQGITFWLTFVDKFAAPTPVGKHPRGASEAEIDTLLRALEAIAHEAGVAMPDDMTVDLLEAQRSGSIDCYERLARYMDEQIAERVLGETLTTNIGSVGSKAAASVHNDVREELSKGDADVQCQMFNRGPITWITELNVPGATPPQVWRVFEEPEDLDARVNRDKTIHSMGFEPSEEYVRETYGGEWSKRAAALPPKAEADPGLESRQTGIMTEFAESDRDEVDGLVDRLEQAAGPALDGLVGDVRRMIEGAASIEDIMERLSLLPPGEDLTRLQEALLGAMAAAELGGAGDVVDESADG
ncbi:MAG: DUF935 domain-containing protein [Rhodospirillaceae bacterium]